MRVLLVEDNPADAYLVEDALERAGDSTIQLEWVKTLADGCDRITRGGIDVVLLDLSLSDSPTPVGPTRLAVLSRVRALSPKLAIVVQTGHDDATLAKEAAELGAQGCVMKGVLAPEALVALLRAAVAAAPAG